jgi:hypothetical protein
MAESGTAWRISMMRIAALLLATALFTLPSAAQDKGNSDRAPGQTGTTPGRSQQSPAGAKDLAPGQRQAEAGGAKDINPGSDIASLRAKREAQCAHRRTMPPDPRDDCARILRDAQLGYGQGGASASSSGPSQASGSGPGIGPGSSSGQDNGIGPGRGGGQGNGIGPGSGGGQGKGRR